MARISVAQKCHESPQHLSIDVVHVPARSLQKQFPSPHHPCAPATLPTNIVGLLLLNLGMSSNILASLLAFSKPAMVSNSSEVCTW